MIMNIFVYLGTVKMCEVAEYFESGELVIFDDSDPAPNYADELESDGTDDSKSDFPEAECAMALLELAQSFGLVSSRNSLGHVGDDPAPRDTTTEPSNMHLSNLVEDRASTASAHQRLTVFDNVQSIGESDLRTTPNCSAFDLLSVVRLDHSYETRRPHVPGSIPSGNKALKKAKSAATLEKLRKIRKQSSKRKTEVGQRNGVFEERQNAALGNNSSPHSDRNVFPASASPVKSQSHHQPSMNALKEVPLEEPFKIPSKAKAVFGIRGKRELVSS